jgi:hypothetical protein
VRGVEEDDEGEFDGAEGGCGGEVNGPYGVKGKFEIGVSNAFQKLTTIAFGAHACEDGGTG